MNPSSAAISSPPQTPGHWLVALGSIILIDIVLAGDNAIAIALAVRNLPQKKRPLGIAIGACGAVVLRIALTSVIASILSLRYVKLAGWPDDLMDRGETVVGEPGRYFTINSPRIPAALCAGQEQRY